MQQLDFYFGSPLVLVPPPMNWQEIQIELSFENDSPDAVLSTAKLVWVGVDAAVINAWFNQGLSGGLGVFAGIPLVIKVCSTQQVVFSGVIDLTDPDTMWSCDKVQCKIINYQIDLFNGLADSVSFAYLASIGVINPTLLGSGGDYVPIQYQRNDIPDIASVMQAILLAYNAYRQVKEIIELGIDAVGAGIGVATGFPSAGAIALAAAQLILDLALIVILALLLVAEFQAIIQCLIQPLRHKLGMYVQTLMEKACSYFGFIFKSTILGAYPGDPSTPYSRLVLMPVKQAWPTNLNNPLSGLFPGFTNRNSKEYDDVVNFTSSGGFAYGYPDMTPGDLIRQMEDVFNARAKIIINSSGQPEMHFERWDFQYNLASFTLPNINSQAPFAAGEPLSAYNPFQTNAADVPANYEVEWQIDTADANTLDSYNGTTCYCTTTVTGLGGNTSMIRNLVERNISFAQAKYKNSYTILEQIVDDFISLFGGGPLWPLGCMQLSSDVTSVPKLFIASSPFVDPNGVYGVGVDPNNRGEVNMAAPNMSAKSLMKYFHFSSLPLTQAPNQSWPFISPFIPSQSTVNQWLIFKNQQIPMCCGDYQLIKNNNYIKTYDGQIARVDSLKWNPYKALAYIDYRIRRPYCNNLQPLFVVDGAQLNQTSIQ